MAENSQETNSLTGLSVMTASIAMACIIAIAMLAFWSGSQWGFLFSVSRYAGIGSAVLLAFILMLTWFDLREFRLPDILTLPMMVTGLGYIALSDSASLVLHILAVLIGYGLIWLIHTLSDSVLGKAGIGMGDAKFLGAICAWTGIFSLPFLLVIASGAGIFVSVLLQIGRRKRTGPTPAAGKVYLPFGPFLGAACWIVWSYGGIILPS